MHLVRQAWGLSWSLLCEGDVSPLEHSSGREWEPLTSPTPWLRSQFQYRLCPHLALSWPNKHNQAVSWEVCSFPGSCQGCHKHMGFPLLWSVHFYSFGLVSQRERVPRGEIFPVSLSSRTVPLFLSYRLRFFLKLQLRRVNFETS